MNKSSTEADENFAVTLSNPSNNAVISTATALGTITNDDVVAVNNPPTLATPITDQTTNEDQAFIFQVPGNTFTDVDTGDTLTYSATLANGDALPTWLTFDAATQTFSGTPTNNDVGSLDIQVTATDNSGATANDTFSLTINNITNNNPISFGTPDNDILQQFPNI